MSEVAPFYAAIMRGFVNGGSRILIDVNIDLAGEVTVRPINFGNFSGVSGWQPTSITYPTD